MVQPHVVAELVRVAQIARGAGAIDHVEGVAGKPGRDVLHQVADAADAAAGVAVAEEGHHVGAIRVAQRVHGVQIPVAGGEHPGQVGVRGRLRVRDLARIDDSQPLRDAAVGVGGVGGGHRQVGEALHRGGAAGGRRGRRSPENHDVDLRGRIARDQRVAGVGFAWRVGLGGRKLDVRVVGGKRGRVELPDLVLAVTGVDDLEHPIAGKDGAGHHVAVDREGRFARDVQQPAVPDHAARAGVLQRALAPGAQLHVVEQVHRDDVVGSCRIRGRQGRQIGAYAAPALLQAVGVVLRAGGAGRRAGSKKRSATALRLALGVSRAGDHADQHEGQREPDGMDCGTRRPIGNTIHD